MKNPKISIITVHNNGQSLEGFVESLKLQTFKDFEVIFVNSYKNECSENNLFALIEDDKRFHQINLPGNEDIVFAKKAGLDVASGDYVCFLSGDETLSYDFIQKLYYENIIISENIQVLEDGRIYKREFIENNRDIEEIVQKKVEEEVRKIYEKLNLYEKDSSEKLNDYYKNTENAINNKIYDISVRFNSLEKLFYDKENEIKENTKSVVENALNNINENNSKIYSDISKVYDYINSEINQKGSEVNHIYTEITNNYKYTEKLKEDTCTYIGNEIEIINEKIWSIKEELELRYTNMQKLVETVAEDMKYKTEAVSLVADSAADINAERIKELLELEAVMNRNLDKIYSYINGNNSKFYEELSKLYKELNDKIVK